MIIVPAYAEISYYRIASFESYLLVFFSITTIGLTFFKKFRWCFLPAIGIWIAVFFPEINKLYQRQIGKGFIGELVSKATDPFKKIAVDWLLNVTDFSWSGYVFLLGLLVLSLVSVLLIFCKR
jgi:hypothetical protein